MTHSPSVSVAWRWTDPDSGAASLYQPGVARGIRRPRDSEVGLDLYVLAGSRLGVPTMNGRLLNRVSSDKGNVFLV